MSAKATDKDGDTSAAATISSPIQVYSGSFLPPLQTGKDNILQKGQVAPVQISVTGCDGGNLTGLTPTSGSLVAIPRQAPTGPTTPCRARCPRPIPRE